MTGAEDFVWLVMMMTVTMMAEKEYGDDHIRLLYAVSFRVCL